MQAETNSITTTTLLQALLESRNDAAWRTIDDRYRPIVLRLAERAGLSSEDAADVAQETLAQLVQDYQDGKYDAQRGRLRAWMIGIARHRIADVLRRRAVDRDLRQLASQAEVPDSSEFSRLWDIEAARVLLERAVDELQRSSRLSTKTVEAFRLQVIEEVPPEQVMERLNMSLRAVYLAKHRCLRRMGEIVEGLRRAYELD
jgi:RNA polymerase sigma-70 factor (ECF subfamily)